MSVIETLTEGIRARSLANEGEALLGKWEKTGLLEGLGEIERGNMSRLLENQAAQLLKETSTMAAGDVDGFAAVASQSCAVYSAIFWHRTLFRSNR